MSSTLESYELIRFAEAFEGRIATAGEMLAGRPGLEAEKSWLTTALELVRTTRAPAAGVVDRVKDLPELDEAREEYAFHQQGLWVDSLEKLHAGITFTASSRAPVIEALFPHLKFAQLRRAPREVVFEYATSYERRTRSSYVSRIFAREDFALVRPVMDQVAAAHAAWRASHEPAPLSLEQEAVLREELVNLGRKLEVALRQARLLSEAALVPVPSVHEAAALGLKPKRKAGRGLAPSDDGLGALDLEPSDSMEPTEAELAEVAALDSSSDDQVPTRPPHASNRDVPLDEEAVDTRMAHGKEPATAGPRDGSTDTVGSDELATSGPEASVDDAAPGQGGARGRKREAHVDAHLGKDTSDSQSEAAPSLREFETSQTREDEPGAATAEPRESAPRGRRRESEEAPSSGDDSTNSAEASRPGSGRGRKRAAEAGLTSGEAPGPSEGERGRRARDAGSAPTTSDPSTESGDSRTQAARGRARDAGSSPTAGDSSNDAEGSRAQPARDAGSPPSADDTFNDSEGSRAQPARGRSRGAGAPPTVSDNSSAAEDPRTQPARGRHARDAGSPSVAGDTSNAAENARAQPARGRARDSGAPTASDDSAAPAPSRAQAPAVRKKKGVTSTPGAAGTETP
ncbi:hypothetical protein [Myxococcus qinghaiensis]|uniref:hypothetical protein n=1 Tax=Myxococcus qinghaiensis TaxID=2906758 RepID=UPI0020A73270|nr:hypothetical protein [Myxococcus qinghaiensis]MCP3161738.1 hypothetical protein [Myxococcus qinghaiensis]